MNTAKAKQILEKHASGLSSGGDSLGDWLRPYKGIDPNHFSEIIKALLAIAPGLNSNTRVDRRTVVLIWDLLPHGTEMDCWATRTIFPRKRVYLVSGREDSGSLGGHNRGHYAPSSARLRSLGGIFVPS